LRLSPFKFLAVLTVSYLILTIILAYSAPALYRLTVIAFWLYMVFLLTKVRSYIRNKYFIPVGACGPLEDCCVSFWCGCCSVTQLARHTADYRSSPAACCSDTGLTDQAPLIVVPVASSMV
jgi:Cys-rich protein (TIGR01571 family)